MRVSGAWAVVPSIRRAYCYDRSARGREPWGQPRRAHWPREERRERRRREGVFVQDGEFRYRLPVKQEEAPATPVPVRVDETSSDDGLGISWYKPQQSMLGVPRSLVAQSTF